jgi:hypothetical protein
LSGSNVSQWINLLEKRILSGGGMTRYVPSAAMPRISSYSLTVILKASPRTSLPKKPESASYERLAAAAPLRALVDAGQAAARGDFELALALTDSVRLEFQVTRPPDPFAAAVFHLFRGDWGAATSEPARADRERLWYEASDVEGWPEGLSQSGEVDGALATFARLKRARALLAPGSSAGDSLTACSHLARIGELWSDVDPVLRPLADEAATLAKSCPP